MNNYFTLPTGQDLVRDFISGWRVIGKRMVVWVHTPSGTVLVDCASEDDAIALRDRLREWLNESAMPPLYQLPTGDWIDLRGIGLVGAHAIVRDSIGIVRLKDHRFQHVALVDFPDIDAARAYRDELARLVNKARAAQ